MKSLVVRFVKNESGATAIEYGLIAAGISVAIIAVVQGLGTKLTSTFKSASVNLKYKPSHGSDRSSYEGSGPWPGPFRIQRRKATAAM